MTVWIWEQPVVRQASIERAYQPSRVSVMEMLWSSITCCAASRVKHLV